MPSEPVQLGRSPAKQKAPAIGKVVRTGKELGGSSSNLAMWHLGERRTPATFLVVQGLILHKRNAEGPG